MFMNTEQIARLLINSGIRVFGVDGQYIYIEDPACILRSFETFIEYAWIVIVCITGLMLFGWAASMIRGAKNDIFTNLRNLTLIFGVLGASVPIVNMIWGDDLFARGCRRISVPLAQVNKILDARNDKLKSHGDYDLYEQLNIDDTGPIYTDTRMPNEIPYADAPLQSAGEVVMLSDAGTAPDVATTITPTTHTNASNLTSMGRTASETSSNVATTTAYTSGMRPNHATASGKDVIFTDSTGARHKRTGGSRAWRNINPGNIRFSDFARRMGAIGNAGGFAVFPDESTGMTAIKELLKSNSYNKLTVAGAISRYAPPHENDTAAYHRQIEKLTGLSINTRMADLSDEQLSRVAGAIRQIEGWTPGRIIKLEPQA